jgi:hypothetical protein
MDRTGQRDMAHRGDDCKLNMKRNRAFLGYCTAAYVLHSKLMAGEVLLSSEKLP